MDRPVKVPWGRGAAVAAVDAAAIDELLPLVEAGTGATFLVRAAPSAPSSLMVPLPLLMRGRLDAIIVAVDSHVDLTLASWLAFCGLHALLAEIETLLSSF